MAKAGSASAAVSSPTVLTDAVPGGYGGDKGGEVGEGGEGGEGGLGVGSGAVKRSARASSVAGAGRATKKELFLRLP